MERLVVATLLLIAAAGDAHAADRDASLIDSFQMLCAMAPPTFDGTSAKATAMKLPVHQDIGQPPNGGPFARSKSWYVTLTTGTHELVTAEANGPKGYIVSCGISALDPDGEAFKTALVATLQLGPPSSETVSPDGGLRMTLWNGRFGDGTVLRFIDGSPKGKPGAMLLYDVVGPPRP